MRGKGKLETRGDSAEAAEALAVVAADVRRTRAPRRRSLESAHPETEGGTLAGRVGDEAREVVHLPRRIAALLLRQLALEANYQRVSAGPETGKLRPAR